MPNHVELLELLLKNRGILPENKERFLNPSYENDLYDPYLLKDMEKAVVRIFESIEAKEKIVIYSDYDCDGIPAAVIMNDFLKKINYENFIVYIPDRHDEGYGLHMDAIEQFIKDEVKLLITFDLGITAIDEVAQAQACGMDVIITDHHLARLLPNIREGGQVQENIPKAFAIINPKQNGCIYPDKMLCGASLAFKLVQALIKKYGEYWKIQNGWEKWLLDMAGIATLSDQVPLIDENRVLAYYGLKVLQKTRRPGLAELFNKAGVDVSKLNEEDVTFTLAPRLNAASRMDSPMRAFEVLATTDAKEAKTLADHLLKINDERKYIVAHIMKEVKGIMNKREEKPIIVIGNPNWRVGVLGLIASKVAEEYKKPAFVWGKEGSDIIRGSCRSWGNINLVNTMLSLPEKSLLEFGGHVSAGGFAVAHEEIHFLEERLLKVFAENSVEEKIEEERMIDATITINDVNNDNYNVIEKLAPFGVGNPKPTFLLKKALIINVKEFGKDKNHLELTFLNSKNKPVKAITFFKTRESFNTKINAGDIIDFIATFEKSYFGGRTELRLRIVDIL
ncbi:MAG TPA: single-stranded-DNA-specific exonuclease RecJ [Candidatus Paceibacterota bacterium]|nr:single-stranded-DNA-specific exonuclease RecJ [Candidatus Paceibacterota bacterium]